MGSGTLRKYYQIFLKKMKNTATKYPPICDTESFKVYRNPCIRAELSEIFKIDVVLHDVQNGTRTSTSISLGSRNRGIYEKTVIFQKYPDFSAPEKLKQGSFDHFEHRAQLRRF